MTANATNNDSYEFGLLWRKCTKSGGASNKSLVEVQSLSIVVIINHWSIVLLHPSMAKACPQHQSTFNTLHWHARIVGNVRITVNKPSSHPLAFAMLSVVVAVVLLNASQYNEALLCNQDNAEPTPSFSVCGASFHSQ